jgi:hypothetical protein
VSFPKFLPWINIPLLKARIVRVTKIWSGIAAKKSSWIIYGAAFRG